LIKPEEFVRMFQPNKDYKQPKEKSTSPEKLVSFGTIDPEYASGNPSVIYDMDISTGSLSKPLKYLESYVPAASDRVMIINGVIIGKIL
jgi:hypothetical protein